MANNQLKEELILSTQHFDSKIDSVIQQLNKVKKQGSKVGDGFNGSMSKMIQKATGFNGSMSSLIGVVGKFSGALGIAVTAGEAFNKMIHSSQTLEDEFGTVQQQVNTVVDNFFHSLASGDFTPFLNGIDNMIGRAKDAYDAMDDLWNMSQSFSTQSARLNNQFQKNLLEIRQKKGSKDPNDIKRVKELTAQNQRIIKQQASGANKLYDQTIKGLQARIMSGTGMNIKLSGGLISSILESDINDMDGNRKKFAAQYQKYLDERAKLDRKADKKQGDLFMGKSGVNYQKQVTALYKKYGKAIGANYLLNRLNDDELKEYNDKLKQGLSYQGQSIANASKLLRYTKEINEVSGGKKSGGKGNKTKISSFSAPTVDINETLRYPQEVSDEVRKALAQADDSFKDFSNETKNWTLDFNPYKEFVENEKTFKKSFENFATNTETIGGTFFSLDSVIGNIESLTNAIGEGANAWEIFIGVLQTGFGIIETVSSAIEALNTIQEILGITTLATAEQSATAGATEMATAAGVTTAKSVEAGATATAEATKMGFPALLFAIPLAIAAVLAGLSAIGGFANGGIVGGNSFGGDRLFARVNSGEAILNTNQQQHLFELLNNGGGFGTNGGNVQFVIRGKDLHGVLANYNDKMKKVI